MLTLTKGKIQLKNCDHTVLVDPVDFPALNQHKWRKHQQLKTPVTWSRINDRSKLLQMNRLITEAPSTHIVKYKDGNWLNNQRQNLISQPRKYIKDLTPIKCACGCGQEISPFDENGIERKFVNGHNARKYHNSQEASIGHKNVRQLWLKSNSAAIRKSKKAFYRRRKLKAMAFLGNQCELCGLKYNDENAPIFEFDHLNPTEKQFTVSRMMNILPWEKVIKELEKCRLLCANCHNQHHGGKW